MLRISRFVSCPSCSIDAHPSSRSECNHATFGSSDDLQPDCVERIDVIADAARRRRSANALMPARPCAQIL